MEILTPEKVNIQEPKGDIQADQIEQAVELKNLEFLNYLEMNDSVMDMNVMEKIQFLSDNVFDVDSLLDLDIRLGNDNGMSKLDKIYTYLKLNQQADKIREHERLIREQMRKYESSE
jgi:hypothetical protein